MSIPNFESLMLPLLKLLKDEREYYIRDVVALLACDLNLTDIEIKNLYSRSKQPIFEKRVRWAITYLSKALLVKYPRRGYIKITMRGFEVLCEDIQVIDIQFLRNLSEFEEWYQEGLAKVRHKNKERKESVNDVEKWNIESEEDDDELWETESDIPLTEVTEDDWQEDDLEAQIMSVKIFKRKMLLKLCDEDLDGELIFEGEDNSIVFNCLTDEQRIVTVWNRSAALAIAKAIYKYYDLAPAN